MPTSTSAARPTNAALVDRYVRDRDHAAFCELTRRLGPLVWSLAVRNTRHREDAEDVLQLVFAELARRAGTIAEPSAVAGWLHTLTIRTASAVRSRKTPRPGLPSDPIDPASLNAVGGQAELDALSDELDRLPSGWREPLLLRYFAGLTNEEAAERLGTTVAALEGRLKRGKNTLRVRLLKRGVGVAGVLLAAAKLSADAAAAPPELDWPELADAASELTTDADFCAMSAYSKTAPSVSATSTATTKTTLLAVAAAAIALSFSGGFEPTTIPAELIDTATAAAEPPTSTELLSTQVVGNERSELELPRFDNASKDASVGDSELVADQSRTTTIPAEIWREPGFEARTVADRLIRELNERFVGADSPRYAFEGTSKDGSIKVSYHGAFGFVPLEARVLSAIAARRKEKSETATRRFDEFAEAMTASNDDLPPEFRSYLRELSEQIRDYGDAPTTTRGWTDTAATESGRPVRTEHFHRDMWEATGETAEAFWDRVLTPLNAELGNPDAYRFAGIDEGEEGAVIEVSGEGRSVLPIIVRTTGAAVDRLRRESRDELADYIEPLQATRREASDVRPDEHPYVTELDRLIADLRSEVAPPPTASVRLRFAGKELHRAVQELGRSAGLRVHVDPEAMPLAETPVTIDAELTVEEALRRLVTEQSEGLDYVFNEESLRLTTTRRAGELMRTETYPVPPGLHANEAASLLPMHAVASRRGPVHWFGDAAKEPATTPGTVNPLDDRLIVTQSDRGHEAVREFLKLLAKAEAETPREVAEKQSPRGRQTAVSAADAKQPVVVVYEAEWCLPCKRLRQSIGVALRQSATGFRVVYQDVDDSLDDPEVDQIPTLVLMSSDLRTEIDRREGYVSAGDLIEWLGEEQPQWFDEEPQADDEPQTDTASPEAAPSSKAEQDPQQSRSMSLLEAAEWIAKRFDVNVAVETPSFERANFDLNAPRYVLSPKTGLAQNVRALQFTTGEAKLIASFKDEVLSFRLEASPNVRKQPEKTSSAMSLREVVDMIDAKSQLRVEMRVDELNAAGVDLDARIYPLDRETPLGEILLIVSDLAGERFEVHLDNGVVEFTTNDSF